VPPGNLPPVSGGIPAHFANYTSWSVAAENFVLCDQRQVHVHLRAEHNVAKADYATKKLQAIRRVGFRPVWTPVASGRGHGVRRSLAAYPLSGSASRAGAAGHGWATAVVRLWRVSVF
jgi:hypothetical protein